MNATLDLLGQAAMTDPTVIYSALYEGPRVYEYKHFSLPFRIVYRYQDVQEMLREPSVFTSGQGQGPNFIAPTGVVSDPPDHTFYRGLVQDTFQPAAIAQLQPRLVEIAQASLLG